MGAGIWAQGTKETHVVGTMGLIDKQGCWGTHRTTVEAR